MLDNAYSDEKKLFEKKLGFTPNSALTSEERRIVAKLIYIAFQGFYDLLPYNYDELVEKIVEQMNAPNNEISAAISLSLSGDIVGGYSALPANTLSRAKMISTMMLLKGLSAVQKNMFLKELPNILGTLPNPPTESFYLSRIAVDPAFQGQGIAGYLLEHFISSAGSHQCSSVSLHVTRENDRAIKFYRKYGFKDYGVQGQKYHCMWRTISD